MTKTATQTAPKFRYIGLTDDVVTCEKCGKPNLKSTVVVAILDADGNEDGVAYYGSTCAAKALAVRGGGAAVLKSARWAQEATILDARDARKRLAFYNLPATGGADRAAVGRAMVEYANVHANAMWAHTKTWADWHAMTLDFIAREQATVAKAALVHAA